MTHARKVLVCLAASFLACAGARALVADSAEDSTEPSESSDTPYQAIVERNVFGLKPPPPPPPPPETKKDVSKIILAGITTMGGNKRAMMKTQTPAKAGQAPQDQWYTLTEGQRDGDIEVVEIDMKAGIVKVKHAGNPVTLDFENNGNKPPVSAALPPPGPGGQAVPGAIPAPPGAAPAPGMPTPAAAPSLKPLPTRTLRAPGGTSGTSATPSAANNTAGLATQGGSVAAAATTAPIQRNGAQKSWPPEVQLTPEEEAILIEAQRGQPGMPPLPPTALSGMTSPAPPGGAPQVPVRGR